MRYPVKGVSGKGERTSDMKQLDRRNDMAEGSEGSYGKGTMVQTLDLVSSTEEGKMREEVLRLIVRVVALTPALKIKKQDGVVSPRWLEELTAKGWRPSAGYCRSMVGEWGKLRQGWEVRYSRRVWTHSSLIIFFGGK